MFTGRIASLILASAGLVVAIAITGCGSSSSATGGSSSNSSGLSTATPDPNATIVANVSAAPITLDPALMEYTQEYGLIASMYSTLTQPVHEKGPIPGVTQQVLDPRAVKPYLATSWKYSEDNKVLTFHLRPGLKFPSGHPLDSAAVKWSLERATALGGGGASVIQEIEFEPPLVKDIATPNPTTVVINYKRPAPNAAANLSSPVTAIIDPGLVEEHGGVQEGKPNEWLASHDAGYGPYLLKDYAPGHRMELEENPDFFESPKTKNVVFNFITDKETLQLNAKTGSADITIGASPQTANFLSNDQCCVVVAGTSRLSYWVKLPKYGKVPVLDNRYSREALAYAVPYKAILEKVGYGYGTLYDGQWPPSFSVYDPAVGKPHEYNLAKAKELMKKSGLENPSLTLNTPVGEIGQKEVAAALAGAWEEIGVHTTVQQIPLSQFFETNIKHTAANTELEGPPVAAPGLFWSYDLQCPPENPYNLSVCLPEADKLMHEVQYGVFADDPEKEQEVLNEVDQMYIGAVAKIWLYNVKLVSILSNSITSYYSSDVPEARFWAKH